MNIIIKEPIPVTDLLNKFISLPSGQDFYVYGFDTNEFFYGSLNSSKFSKKKTKGTVYSSKGYKCKAVSEVTQSNKAQMKYSGKVSLKCENKIF